MKIAQENLSQMAFILRQMADDLESGGVDEWKSFDDVTQATANNVTHDFNEYKKEVEKDRKQAAVVADNFCKNELSSQG